MNINFFEHQEKAHKRTVLLVLLFVLAVGGIGVGIYLPVGLALALFDSKKNVDILIRWEPEVFFCVMTATVGFIGVASLVRIRSLREGGGGIARMLGGRAVSRDTKDPLERRLLNIVDEMAIASGVPVPEVYVLDKEVGINAFAAGYTVEDAVVAVTQGTLEELSRDELQGVIAHEFSHILNGDMRLNLRLIGVLFGILTVAVVGRMLLKSATSSSWRLPWQKDFGPGMLGLFLVLVGYIGVLVGHLIQAAISREREFLADASAVQFTRNPEGIGGALLKITGLKRGSVLQAPRALEAAHLFFGQGVHSIWGLFSTHPPIKERIRRIDPYLLARLRTSEQTGEQEPKVEEPIPGVMGLAGTTGTQQRFQVDPMQVVARMGTVTPAILAFASDLVASLSNPVREAITTSEGAAHVAYAVLLASKNSVRNVQVQILVERGVDVGKVEGIARQLGDVDHGGVLALVELAAPALRNLPPERQDGFLRTIKALIQADRRVTLFEFGVYWLLTRRLKRRYSPPRAIYRNIEKVVWEAAQVIAAVARAGNKGDAAAGLEAFRVGLEQLGSGPVEEMVHEFQAGRLGSLHAVARALDHLTLSSLAIRRWVIEAVSHCALADRKVTAEEAEILRLISIALGLPLPPWVGLGTGSR